MRLQIPTSELKTAIAGLSKVVNKRAPIPVLSCLRLDAEGQTVRLTGTSIDQTATYEIAMAESVSVPVSVLIPLDALQAVLKTAQGSNIEIEPGKDAVTIVTEVAGQNIGRCIETLEIQDWPELAPPSDTNPVEPGFLTQIRTALTFASTDDSRTLLKSVLLDMDAKKGHRIVATDSRRLNIFPCGILPLAESVIVPSTKFLNWSKLYGDTRIGADKKTFTLRCGPWVYTTQVVEGAFPRYTQVVPDYGKDISTVELSPEDVQVLVKTLPGMPGHEGADGTIILRLAPKAVRVCSRESDKVSEAAIRLEKSVCSGTPVSIGLDRRFFRDALLAGFRLWQVRDSTSPLVGQLSREDVQSCHILMPVRCANVDAEPASEGAGAPEVAVPEPIHPQPKETPMPKKHVQSQATTEPGSLDKILVAYEAAKSAVRDANNALASVAQCVRDAIKEDRARRKEISDVRAGLAKLQAIRV